MRSATALSEESSARNVGPQTGIIREPCARTVSSPCVKYARTCAAGNTPLCPAASIVKSEGIVVNVTSDAGVEPYEGWGGYGSSKAALDQLTAILGAENPTIAAYAFDPGDMRTQMHQDAFPGEDISDRPLPDEVAVPSLLHVLATRPPSGLVRAGALEEVA